MTNRRTGIGAMFREDRELGRRELIETIQLAKGKVQRIAKLLGLNRRWVYRMLYREELWGEVDRVRAIEDARKKKVRTEGPDWVAKTRSALKDRRHGIQRQ